MNSMLKKIQNRIAHYTVRLNKYQVFSNRLRMLTYQYLAGIEVGENSVIWAGNKITDSFRLKLGRNSIIGPSNVFLSRGGVTIGNNVNISGYSFFISQQHDLQGANFLRTTYGEIEIKDRVWVATNCTIMPGVTIHKGAVIAAGAVVTKDVEPWTVVAGNPAKPISIRAKQENYEMKAIKGSKWL